MNRSRTTSSSSAESASTTFSELGFVSAGFAPASSIARSGYGSPVRIPSSAVIVWHSRRTS